MIDWCKGLLTEVCGGEAFLTPSCTAALELACMLVLKPGDEVILPSWAFPSCANAIILRGAIPVFVDVDSNLNIDPDSIEQAITAKTKAVMVIHYAGVLAQMDRINAMAQAHGLYVIEDAAQAFGNWKCTGDFGCLSFHRTKNIECDQGGALIVRNEQFVEAAEMMSQCGTDKAKFYRGEQDSYSWLEVGSQYVMSEHQAKVLKENLSKFVEITEARKRIWEIYYTSASGVCNKATEVGNGHFYWFEYPDKWNWIRQMREKGIKVTSHFEALHTTIPGRKYGRASGPIHNSIRAMQRLVKLDTSVSEDEARIFCEAVWPTQSIL